MMKNTTKKTTYTLLTPETKTPPTVIFSKRSLKWIENLVKAHTGEVGFYGIVDTKEDYTFYVRDIFYPKQQLVSSATCEISTEGGTEVAEWLMAHDRADDIGKMILWGHSHHSMGVDPSSQDNAQALELIKTTGQSLIRIIVNNDGLISLSFFDFTNQIRFDDVKWEADTEESDEVIAQRMTKIAEIMASDKPVKEKFTEINKLSSDDAEEAAIKEKIDELKKLNIPTPVTTHYGHGHSVTSQFHSAEGGFDDELYSGTGFSHHSEYGRGYFGRDGRQLSFLHDLPESGKKGKKNKNKITSHSSESASSFAAFGSKTFLDDSRRQVEEVMKEWEG